MFQPLWQNLSISMRLLSPQNFFAPLKFITLSTFFFFCSLSKFTNSSTFFSVQNFSISNSLLLSQKRTNFTRSKVGVQSHAKSPSKPKKHGARQNKRISVPSDSYTLANSPTTIAQETTKATGKTRWVNTRFPLSLSLFLSSISPCNKLAIVLAETTSINICG